MKKALLLFVLFYFVSSAQNWQVVSSGTTGDIWGIDWVNSTTVWICAANGDVKKSVDGGSTFTAAGNAGEGAYCIAALSADVACVALGPSSGNGKIMRTTNGGTSWAQVYTATGAWFNTIDNIDANILWAVSDPIGGVFHIVKSTDAGATWALAPNLPAQPATTVFGANSSFYRVGNTCWFGTGGSATTSANRVYKSTNGADGPWTFGTTSAAYVGAIAFSSASGNGLSGFWQATNTVNKSADGGATWTAVTTTTALTRGLDYIPGTNWAWAAASAGIFKTSDNGATWVADALPAGVTADFNWVRFYGDANKGIAGGPAGVLLKSLLPSVVPVELTSFTAAQVGGTIQLKWSTATETNNFGFEIERSVNNSGEWSTIGFKPGVGTSTQNQQYIFTDNISGLSLTSASYRLKQIDYDGKFEYSKAVVLNDLTPFEFSVAQNYPNPFNPSTVLKVTLPAEQFVSVKVYNSLGQYVSTLVNGMINAGVHQFEFNAEGLSSGAYYAVVNAGENTSTIKMMLSK